MAIEPVAAASRAASRPAPRNPADESLGPGATRTDALLAIKTESIAEHDPTLLLAALEDIESRRLAIESLLDADLLWRCLI
jgi:hypothetical protein